MTVKREDLAAAAAEGVLQYTQIEPVLIFLLRRDVQMHRTSAFREQKGARFSGRRALCSMAAILAIGLAMALVAFHTRLASDVLGISGLVWFITLYGLFAVAMAASFERWRFGSAARIVCTAVIALAPLAILASLHVNLA
ncbi:MAG: hypothetical protein V4632_09190 [Pseudomonadota bacterium]